MESVKTVISKQLKQSNMRREKAIERYKGFIEDLMKRKNGADNISFLISKHRISKVAIYALLNLGAVYKENGCYYWNKKIPVSKTLIESTLDEVNRMHNKYNQVKQKPKRKYVRKPKQESEIQVVFSDKKVGLIRRFLRWIY